MQSKRNWALEEVNTKVGDIKIVAGSEFEEYQTQDGDVIATPASLPGDKQQLEITLRLALPGSAWMHGWR